MCKEQKCTSGSPGERRCVVRKVHKSLITPSLLSNISFASYFSTLFPTSADQHPQPGSWFLISTSPFIGWLLTSDPEKISTNLNHCVTKVCPLHTPHLQGLMTHHHNDLSATTAPLPQSLHTSNKKGSVWYRQTQTHWVTFPRTPSKWTAMETGHTAILGSP